MSSPEIPDGPESWSGLHYDADEGHARRRRQRQRAVAVLLSAARAIGSREEIAYVAFNGEECGFVGSRAIVDALTDTRLQHAHVLEMVGFTSKSASSQLNPVPMIECPDVGDFLGLVGTHESRQILDHTLACAGHASIPVYGLYLPPRPLAEICLIAPHIAHSDHEPFWHRVSRPSCGPIRPNSGTRTITSRRTRRKRLITISWPKSPDC